MNLNDLTTGQKVEVLRKIEALKDSDGWAILRQIVESEITTYTKKISDPTHPMSVDDFHNTRGIMGASFRFLDLPETIVARLDSDIQMAKKMGEYKETEE